MMKCHTCGSTKIKKIKTIYDVSDLDDPFYYYLMKCEVCGTELMTEG